MPLQAGSRRPCQPVCRAPGNRQNDHGAYSGQGHELSNRVPRIRSVQHVPARAPKLPPERCDVFEIDGASNNGVDQIGSCVTTSNTCRSTVASRFTSSMKSTCSAHRLSTHCSRPWRSRPPMSCSCWPPPSRTRYRSLSCPAASVTTCAASRLPRSAVTCPIVREGGSPSMTQGLELIAGQAEGSMRDALSLLDQVISGVTGACHRQSILDILGIIDRKSVSDYARPPLRAISTLFWILSVRCMLSGTAYPIFIHRSCTISGIFSSSRWSTAPESVLDLPDTEIRGHADPEVKRCLRDASQPDPGDAFQCGKGYPVVEQSQDGIRNRHASGYCR
jgi:hypothetical protein